MITVKSNRDSQRQRLYDAETEFRKMIIRSHDAPVVEIHGSKITLPVVRSFAEIEDIQRYVDKVLALNWVMNEYARSALPVKVRARKSDLSAHYSPLLREIAIPDKMSAQSGIVKARVAAGGTAYTPRWAMNEIIVLHELAHHLTEGRGAAHGPEFVSCVLDLYKGIIGVEAAWILEMLFYDNGVQVHP